MRTRWGRDLSRALILVYLVGSTAEVGADPASDRAALRHRGRVMLKRSKTPVAVVVGPVDVPVNSGDAARAGAERLRRADTDERLAYRPDPAPGVGQGVCGCTGPCTGHGPGPTGDDGSDPGHGYDDPGEPYDGPGHIGFDDPGVDGPAWGFPGGGMGPVIPVGNGDGSDAPVPRDPPREPTGGAGGGGPKVAKPTEPVATCPEGTTRPKPGANPTTCTWTILGGEIQVQVVSQSGHGDYGVDGAGTMFTVMRSAGSLVPKVGKVLKVGGMVGEAAVDAATRWARQNARGIVDLTILLPRNSVTVRCVPVQVCENGRWVDTGSTGAIVKTEALSPLRIQRADVLGAELEATVGRLLNSGEAIRLIREHQAYEMDPCSCGGTSDGGPSNGGGGAAGPGPAPEPRRRDCTPIEERLLGARERLGAREAERDAARRARDAAEERRAGIQRDQEQAVREATDRLRKAESEEQKKSDYYRGLIENQAPEASLDRGKAASDAATRAARQADDALRRARTPRPELAAAAEEVTRLTRELEAKEGPVREARAEVERIEAELDACRKES